jgi:hypothetical protein
MKDLLRLCLPIEFSGLSVTAGFVD